LPAPILLLVAPTGSSGLHPVVGPRKFIVLANRVGVRNRLSFFPLVLVIHYGLRVSLAAEFVARGLLLLWLSLAFDNEWDLLGWVGAAIDNPSVVLSWLVEATPIRGLLNLHLFLRLSALVEFKIQSLLLLGVSGLVLVVLIRLLLELAACEINILLLGLRSTLRTLAAVLVDFVPTQPSGFSRDFHRELWLALRVRSRIYLLSWL